MTVRPSLLARHCMVLPSVPRDARTAKAVTVCQSLYARHCMPVIACPSCIVLPPVPRDARTAKAVTAAVQGLKRRGVQAAQVRCRRLPLTPLFLSDRIPLFPVRLSQEVRNSDRLLSQPLVANLCCSCFRQKTHYT